MKPHTYQLIYDHVVHGLLPGLPDDLTYHSIHHTMDVLEQVQRIAAEEGNINEEHLQLLKIAALYHDTGFLFEYTGHEEAGCLLAKKNLPGFGLNNEEIDLICGMIMATKLPQSPKNILEQIICDADLDYLGRPDFFSIGEKLFFEMKERGLISNDDGWDKLQVQFMKEHQYFTITNSFTREKQKSKHREILEDRINRMSS